MLRRMLSGWIGRRRETLWRCIQMRCKDRWGCSAIPGSDSPEGEMGERKEVGVGREGVLEGEQGCRLWCMCRCLVEVRLPSLGGAHQSPLLRWPHDTTTPQSRAHHLHRPADSPPIGQPTSPSSLKQYPINTRAISEQYQSNIRAISEQNRGKSR